MKRILKYLLALVLGFECLTALFLLVYHKQYAAYSMLEIAQTLWYSLGNHLLVAANVLLPVAFAELIHVHLKGNWYRLFLMIYLSVVAIVISTLCGIDIVLYAYWGFRINLTPFVYILDNPISAMHESPAWAIWGTFGVMALLVAGVYRLVSRNYPREEGWGYTSHAPLLSLMFRTMSCNALLLLLLLLSWGGTSKHNLGMQSAYFSDEVLLNHAATNPVYSFFHALKRQQKPLDRQYRYFDDGQEVWQAEWDVLVQNRESAAYCDTTLLATPRPNILLVIFESFSGAVCNYLYPEADASIMPRVNSEMSQGLAFTRLYANSFRTERGLVSILSAYPAQPTYTVMTDTLRCKNLDYLTAQLHQVGYRTRLMHGGDDDFCRLKHFLRCAEVEQNIGRYDFDPADYDYPKGLHDEKMARFAYRQAHEANERGERFLHVYTTMSSHEPFKVPFNRFDEPYLNSVAYADSCFGLLMDDLRADTALWRNLLVIGLSDHCCASWPKEVQQHHPLRYHIPMFWTGGAVRGGHRDVDVFCQQTDLTATLLHQMNLAADSACRMIDTRRFLFSRDIFDPRIPHFAFYTWPDGFGLLTDSCRYIQDNNDEGHPLPGSNDPAGHAQRLGKAYLQAIYDDLSKR